MADRTTRLNLEDTTEVIISPATETTSRAIAGLVTSAYDYIALTWTGSNLTQVVYKTGGASGTTVATLTLAYTGSRLDSITKS